MGYKTVCQDGRKSIFFSARWLGCLKYLKHCRLAGGNPLRLDELTVLFPVKQLIIASQAKFPSFQLEVTFPARAAILCSTRLCQSCPKAIPMPR